MFINNYYLSKPGYVCDAYGSGFSTQYFWPLPAWQADDGAATGVAGNNAYYYPGAPLKQTSGCGTVAPWTAMATTALSAHPDPLLPTTCGELAVISPALPGSTYQLYDGNGRAVHVGPMKPTLKEPGTKRLKLNYDVPLSTFAFKFNLRRYTTAGSPRRHVASRLPRRLRRRRPVRRLHTLLLVGRCWLTL